MDAIHRQGVDMINRRMSLPAARKDRLDGFIPGTASLSDIKDPF